MLGLCDPSYPGSSGRPRPGPYALERLRDLRRDTYVADVCLIGGRCRVVRGEFYAVDDIEVFVRRVLPSPWRENVHSCDFECL